MFSLLTHYFLQSKKLHVPGVGAFALETRDAVNDFASQTLQAPGWDVVFVPFMESSIAVPEQDNEGLYDWLVEKMNVSKEDAVIKYDDFCDALKADLKQGKIIIWEGLGTLEKINNKIVFNPDASAAVSFTSVTAKKVLRENVSHNVLVGEKETTTEEMRTRLAAKKSRGNLGLKIAWIVLLVALVLLAIYFLQNGCNLNSMGNQQKAGISKPSETYRLR